MTAKKPQKRTTEMTPGDAAKGTARTPKRLRGRPRKLPPGVSRKLLKDGTEKYFAWIGAGARGRKQTFPLRATLPEALEDRLAALKADRELPRDVLPLAEAVETVENRLVAQRRREGTLRWFKEKAAVVLRHFGPDALLEEVDRKGIEALRDALLKRGLSPGAVAHVRRALSMVLRGNPDHVRGDPLRGVAWPQAEAREMHYFRAAEVAKIVQAIRASGMLMADHDADTVSLLFLTGWRRMEAARVQVEDLDLKTKPPRVFLQGKRGNVAVPVSKEASVILERLAQRAGGSGPLMPGGWQGIVRTFRRWRLRLKEPRLHPHSLRHSFVTAAVNAGLPLPVVQSLARHASPVMTTRYFHAGPESAAAVAKISLGAEAPARSKPKGRPRGKAQARRLRRVV